MKGSSGTVRLALAVAVLLASLVLVAWRQSRAYEALSALDALRRETELAGARRAELERRIRELESRSRVVPEARRRLGMHVPDASEIVYLPGGAR